MARKFDFSKLTGFDWNEGNLKHIKKHNVIREECEETFLDKQPEVTPDETHSQIEQRYRVYGRTDNGRLLFMIITIRNNKIRVISTRDQNKKERKEFMRGGEDIRKN